MPTITLNPLDVLMLGAAVVALWGWSRRPPAPPQPKDTTAQILGEILKAIHQQNAIITGPSEPDPQLSQQNEILRRMHESFDAYRKESMRALDTQALKMADFVRAHQHMLEIMFGRPDGQPVGPGREDAEPEIRRTAEKFMDTYGIPWEEALKRAKAYRVYQPNDSPMRAEV